MSLDQLKQAIALKEQIAALETQLAGIMGGAAETPTTTTSSFLLARLGRPPGSKMSAEARARIAAAQKARWAKYRGSQGTVPASPPRKKRMISPIHRARIVAAQKARWAKVRKEKGIKG